MSKDEGTQDISLKKERVTSVTYTKKMQMNKQNPHQSESPDLDKSKKVESKTKRYANNSIEEDTMYLNVNNTVTPSSIHKKKKNIPTLKDPHNDFLTLSSK